MNKREKRSFLFPIFNSTLSVPPILHFATIMKPRCYDIGLVDTRWYREMRTRYTVTGMWLVSRFSCARGNGESGLDLARMRGKEGQTEDEPFISGVAFQFFPSLSRYLDARRTLGFLLPKTTLPNLYLLYLFLRGVRRVSVL